jgi:uncharacterized protein
MAAFTIADPSLLTSPWNGGSQTNRQVAASVIIINGLDVTQKLHPYLIQVRVMCGVMLEDYNAEIELDDSYGQLPIPAIGSPATIGLGWQNEGTSTVFIGEVHDVEHACNRKAGGRRMWIHAFGANMLGHGKTPMQNHVGEGASSGDSGTQIPIVQPITEAAQNAGHSIQVHPQFAGVTDDYWHQNESYYHYVRRLADEHGGLFRVIAGTNGQFTVQGQNIDGTPTPTIAAVWGQNLFAWRVRPLSTRQMWATAQSMHFDVNSGWQQKTQDVSSNNPVGGMASAQYGQPTPAASGQAAQNDNTGVDDVTGQVQGPGRIYINGEPTAQGNCYVALSGARPGVDGTYWCQTAEHIYSRAEGYVTWLDIFLVQITGQDGPNPPYTSALPPVVPNPIDTTQPSGGPTDPGAGT